MDFGVGIPVWNFSVSAKIPDRSPRQHQPGFMVIRILLSHTKHTLLTLSHHNYRIPRCMLQSRLSQSRLSPFPTRRIPLSGHIRISDCAAFGERRLGVTRCRSSGITASQLSRPSLVRGGGQFSRFRLWPPTTEAALQRRLITISLLLERVLAAMELRCMPSRKQELRLNVYLVV